MIRRARPYASIAVVVVVVVAIYPTVYLEILPMQVGLYDVCINRSFERTLVVCLVLMYYNDHNILTLFRSVFLSFMYLQFPLNNITFDPSDDISHIFMRLIPHVLIRFTTLLILSFLTFYH